MEGRGSAILFHFIEFIAVTLGHRTTEVFNQRHLHTGSHTRHPRQSLCPRVPPLGPLPRTPSPWAAVFVYVINMFCFVCFA